jgi:hypothetical protein
VFLWDDRRKTPIAVMTGRDRRSAAEAKRLWLDTALGSPFSGRPRQYQPAFGEMAPTYENIGHRARVPEALRFF